MQRLLFLLTYSEKRREHSGTPKKQSRLPPSGFGQGHASLCAPPTAQPWHCEVQRGLEPILERSNSRREGGEPPHRRKCHPGPAPETPCGAAPWLPAAQTHCPLISPRKDACLLQEREHLGSSRPGIPGSGLAQSRTKSFPGALPPEKKMQAAGPSAHPGGATGRSKRGPREAHPQLRGRPGAASKEPKIRPRGGGAEECRHTDRAAPLGPASPKGQLCVGGPGATEGWKRGTLGAQKARGGLTHPPTAAVSHREDRCPTKRPLSRPGHPAAPPRAHMDA